MSIVRRLKRTLGGELAWKNLPLPPDERELLGLLRDPISDDSLREAMGVSVEVLVASMVRRGWVKWETPAPLAQPLSPANPHLPQPSDSPPAETALERLRRKWTATPPDTVPDIPPAPSDLPFAPHHEPEITPSAHPEPVDVASEHSGEIFLAPDLAAAPLSDAPDVPPTLEAETAPPENESALPPMTDLEFQPSDVAEETDPAPDLGAVDLPAEVLPTGPTRPAPTPDEIEKSIHAFLRMLSGEKEASDVAAPPHRKDNPKAGEKPHRKSGDREGRKDSRRDGHKDSRKDR